MADIMLHGMLSAQKSSAPTRAQQHHSPAGVIHHCKIKAEVEFIRLYLLLPQACLPPETHDVSLFRKFVATCDTLLGQSVKLN